ncbi:MAG: metallophosphoesterase [Methylococcales bacterium]
MKINYFSDVHLEFGELEQPDTDADLIIAAGDIGVSRQGIDWLKSFNKPVIYVAGNHEFYGHDYQRTLDLIREECKNSQVHFLENESIVLQGVRFLGCTLWSDLFVDGVDKALELGLLLNDFRHIWFTHKAFDEQCLNNLHQASKRWLSQELARPFSGKTVVVTHHAPSEWSWQESTRAIKKLAYCSDMKALFHEHDIAVWIHGHVHRPADYRIAGARVLCNPRGYMGKKIVPEFDKNRVVEI